MAKVKDKFIIEIDEEYKGDWGEKIYRIKGFNSLVFDDYGISKLDVYLDPPKGTWTDGYAKGYEKGYERGIESGKDLQKTIQYLSRIECSEPYSEPRELETRPLDDTTETTIMPEIGEMEQLANQFFEYCNGITGKGSE